MSPRPNERNKITAEQIAACPDLKEKYRAILTLSLTESYENIKAALELRSIGTVKSRLSRANAALKAALEADAGAAQ
jgi:DNA-directed RNA polymerase specialized sigma24 family protein